MLTGIEYAGRVYRLSELDEKNQLTDNLPTIILKQMGDIRKWNGAPHVTDICVDTRETYLKYTTDYIEDLDHLVRMTMGSLRHGGILTDDLSEVKINNLGVTGSVDNIDIRPNGDIYVCDFKFYSSYSVAKHFGITTQKVDKVDELGNQVYFKNGKPKTETVKTFAPPEKMYITLQLNIYKKLLEETILTNVKLQKAIIDAGGNLEENIRKGHVFDGMGVFLYVTDGGTYMAKNRGITQMSYYDKDIDNIPTIDAIIEKKVNDLKRAFDKKEVPPMCKDIYCMDNRYKCENFCPVRNICKQIGQTGAENQLF